MTDATIIQYLTQAGFAGLAIFLIVANQKREERTLGILDKYADALGKINSCMERNTDTLERIERRIPAEHTNG